MFGVIRKTDEVEICLQKANGEVVNAQLSVEQHDHIRGVSSSIEVITGTTKDHGEKVVITIERRIRLEDICREHFLQLGK